ncbi:MAG: hypothetical protein ACTSQE_09395 [Candidatus Heimdallarchaeaceae archaeon]
MPRNCFILFAPPISFSTTDIYSPFSPFSKTFGSYIKAISDAFFLSNNFRHHNILHFCTQYKNEPYIITFHGKRIRFLGPSFFSAAHLVQRALNHIDNPHSKKGKLTPGLTVSQTSLEELKEKYNDKKWFHITSLEEKKEEPFQLIPNAVYCFGESNKVTEAFTKIVFNKLNIDEQVIITNFLLDNLT